MELFENKSDFEDVVIKAAAWANTEEAIVEKDYYVFLLLRELNKKIPNLVFKGGTSLSKCFGVIQRFSEDIDITLENDKPTQGERVAIKRAVQDVAKQFGFHITNLEDTRSKREYNKYNIDCAPLFASETINKNVLVEQFLGIKPFPLVEKQCGSIIHSYLKENGFDNIIEDFNLEPFTVTTQEIKRTFVDKIFAICDYYLEDDVAKHSRHLYDLYKLLPMVNLDGLQSFVQDVRSCRKTHKICRSAFDGVDVQKLLREILQKDFYKADYGNNTISLLTESVSYEQAKQALEKIYQSKIFE